jgi:hypothetical protein
VKLLGETGFEEGFFRSLDFALGKRPEAENFHSTGQGFGYFGEEQGVGGSRQKEAARGAVGVDTALNGQEKAGGPLDLIENHSFRQPGDEPIRIGLSGPQDGGIVHGEELGLVAVDLEILHQCGLPSLAGTLHKNHRGICQGSKNPRGYKTLSHGVNSTKKWTNINHFMADLQNQSLQRKVFTSPKLSGYHFIFTFKILNYSVLYLHEFGGTHASSIRLIT